MPAKRGCSRVDQLGQLGLAARGRHRQRRDRHPVADPDAGVAGEQQVGQRVDEEVVGGQQGGDQPEAAAHLVVADAGGRGTASAPRARPRRAAGAGSAHRVAEVQLAAARSRSPRSRASSLASVSVSRSVRYSTSTSRSRSACGERVVLVLRPRHPRDAVEEQAVVVARGQPLQLRSGPVEHDGPETCRPRSRRRGGALLAMRAPYRSGLRPESAYDVRRRARRWWRRRVPDTPPRRCSGARAGRRSAATRARPRRPVRSPPAAPRAHR